MSDKVIQLTLDKTDAAILGCVLGAGIAYSFDDTDRCAEALHKTALIIDADVRFNRMLTDLMRLAASTWHEAQVGRTAARINKSLGHILPPDMALMVGQELVKTCRERGHHCPCNDTTCCVCGSDKSVAPLQPIDNNPK